MATEMPEPLEERVLRIEGLLGLRPNLSVVGGSEFWIVKAEGSRGNRSLAYWGPYAEPELAMESHLWEPLFGTVIVEVPT